MKKLININYLKWLLIINLVFFIFITAVITLLDYDFGVFAVYEPQIRNQIASLIVALYPPILREGQLWVIVLSNFSHVYLVHFLVNMLALYHLGGLVGSIFDKSILFVTYIFSGIVASIASLALYGFFGIDFISVGASGSIFGLVGLILGAEIFYKVKRIPFPFAINGFTMLLQLVMIYFFGNNFINHYAHFGGLISGMLLGFIYPKIRYSNKLINGLVTLSMAILFISIASFFLFLVNYLAYF